MEKSFTNGGVKTVVEKSLTKENEYSDEEVAGRVTYQWW